MSSVHHEAAIAFLECAAADPQTVETLRQSLDASFPGWQSNASPLQGYGTPHHPVSLIVGRSIHDALPAPFNGLPYQWDQRHGFGAVMAYLDMPGRTEADIDAVLAAAVIELGRVIADARGEGPTYASGEPAAGKPAKKSR